MPRALPLPHRTKLASGRSCLSSMPLAGRAAYFLHSSNLPAPKYRNGKVSVANYSHSCIKILNARSTEPSPISLEARAVLSLLMTMLIAWLLIFIEAWTDL